MHGILHEAECWGMGRYKEVSEMACFQGAYILLEELTGTNDWNLKL